MSRKKIFESINQITLPVIPLPEIDIEEFRIETDNDTLFKNTLNKIGGKVYETNDLAEVKNILHKDFPDLNNTVSLVDGVDISTINLKNINLTSELNDLDLAVVNGNFGVAENGAVWVTEKDIVLRSIPFITKHLTIILNKNLLVQNMHEAYLRLQDFNEGYGVFIAGPSKTADIEQSLVIGAQGPLSLTLFLI